MRVIFSDVLAFSGRLNSLPLSKKARPTLEDEYEAEQGPRLTEAARAGSESRNRASRLSEEVGSVAMRM